jgi:hypothetical protein
MLTSQKQYITIEKAPYSNFISGDINKMDFFHAAGGETETNFCIIAGNANL